MTLTTSLVEGSFSFSDTVTFSLIFTNPCLSSTWLPAVVANISCSVLAGPVLSTFAAYNLLTAVNCGSVTYSLSPLQSFEATIDQVGLTISV